MTALLKRIRKISVSSQKEPKDSESILDELTSIETDLNERISTIKNEVNIWEAHLEKWLSRSNSAEKFKGQADTVEGEEAMEILRKQAIRYSEFYKIKKENLENKLIELKKSYTKISEVIRGLKTVEKTKDLDDRLRQMAADENIHIQEDENTFDMRAIEQATYTAKALLELQTNR